MAVRSLTNLKIGSRHDLDIPIFYGLARAVLLFFVRYDCH